MLKAPVAIFRKRRPWVDYFGCHASLKSCSSSADDRDGPARRSRKGVSSVNMNLNGLANVLRVPRSRCRFPGELIVLEAVT